MKWLQNTWTKRQPARHQLWGNLFGDRYQAVLVEEGDYLATLIDGVQSPRQRSGDVALPLL